MKKISNQLISWIIVKMPFILLSVTTSLFASSYSDYSLKKSFYKEHPPLYFSSGKSVPFSLNGSVIQVDIDGLIPTESAIEYLPLGSTASTPLQGYSPSSNAIKLRIRLIKNGKTILFHQKLPLFSTDGSVHFDIASESSRLDKQAYNIHVEIKYALATIWSPYSLFEAETIPAYEIIVSDFNSITNRLELDDLVEQLNIQESMFNELQRNYSELMKKLEKKPEKESIGQNEQQTTQTRIIESLDVPTRQIGRYDCVHGNTVTVNSRPYNLTGPLKLHIKGPLDPSVEGFIKVFAVDINDVRYALSLGKENVVEWSQQGPLKINFVLITHEPQSKPWQKEFKNFKMRYHDNFNFHMSVKVEH